MNLRSKTKETLDSAKGAMDEVTVASRRVVETTEWATVALICVSAVSLLALGIGVAAYIRAGQGVARVS
jgi:hypothetical protein